ncbi:dro:myosuppressin receptor [Echinococcus multilocularis]|uniref:Dro:myosuppressin receptor n=1 Tax=Echinococcus multilocularis TaxID=6211 RepID=A0A087VXM9_ECHMU|nr:dro:myosuppressin receptor [Echinococcus multilocularis]
MPNCSSYEYSNFHAFTRSYDIVHIPLSLTICVCGVLANAINVVVLNQPGMQSSTNLLVAALSIGEGTVMAIYIFYVTMYRIDQKLELGMSKPYAYTLFTLVYAQNLFHAFASWMIVFLTAFRLAFMRAGVAALHTCSYNRAKIGILANVVISLILSAPFLFAHQVVKDSTHSVNDTITFKLDFVSSYSLTTLLLVTTGVFMKVLPIVLSTIFTALLIRTLLKSQKRRIRLQNEKTETEQRFIAIQTEQPNNDNNAKNFKRPSTRRSNDHDSNSRNIYQTTNIMIALTVLYIITYLPQAIMLLLLIIYGTCFEVMVYEKLGDFMDLLTLLCYSGNFLLYCALSSKFRETCLHLIHSLLLPRKYRL